MNYIFFLISKIISSRPISSIESSMKLGVILTIPVTFIFNIIGKLTNWSIENEAYIQIMFGIWLTDWVFGQLKHIKNNTWNAKENATKATIKAVVILFGGFTIEALIFFTNDTYFYELLKNVFRLTIFLYPGLSAWENIWHFSGGKWPPIWIKKRAKSFYESGDIDELISKKRKSNEDR